MERAELLIFDKFLPLEESLIHDFEKVHNVFDKCFISDSALSTLRFFAVYHKDGSVQSRSEYHFAT